MYDRNLISYLLYEHNKITNLILIMGAHFEYIKLIIIAEPKTFCFDLPKDTDNNLEHEIDSII